MASACLRALSELTCKNAGPSSAWPSIASRHSSTKHRLVVRPEARSADKRSRVMAGMTIGNFIQSFKYCSRDARDTIPHHDSFGRDFNHAFVYSHPISLEVTHNWRALPFTRLHLEAASMERA